MKRPDGIIGRLEQFQHAPLPFEIRAKDARDLLLYLENVESELAGYRSRDDSGFKRSLEHQG